MARPDSSVSLTFRTEVRPADAARVRAMAASTGFFSPHEVDVAEELVLERLARGEASGYHFLFAEADGHAAGYACFGPIPCTLDRFDLYWIVVDQALRGQGLGTEILARAQDAARAMGAARLYAETSSREQYAPTRAFYEKHGYAVDAVQRDFYRDGEHKVVYLKVL